MPTTPSGRHFLLCRLSPIHTDPLQDHSARTPAVSDRLVDRDERSATEQQTNRPRSIQSCSGCKKGQRQREDYPSSGALRPHSAAHVLGTSSVVFNRHQQAGAAPKPALDLEIPIIAFPASLHGDTSTPQIAFNALQPCFGGLPLLCPHRQFSLHRHRKAGRNTAPPKLETMP